MNVDKSDQLKIKEIVLTVMRDLQGPTLPFFWKEVRPAALSDDLVLDLRIDSDDLSYVFVPELEQRFGITIPAGEWESVHTVQDAVSLLERFVGRRP